MNTPEQSSHWKRSLPALALIFAAPMIGLYLLSIGIAWVFGPKGAPGRS